VLAELLLAAALALGILSPGESPEDRAIRLARVAVALELEARAAWEAPAALAAMDRESDFALDVHTGERRSSSGAVCPAQIDPSNARFSEDLAGIEIEPTRRCVAASLWTLRLVRGHCRRQHFRTHIEAAMHTAYIHGSRCRPSRSGRDRAALARRIAATPWVVTVEMRDAVARARLETLSGQESGRAVKTKTTALPTLQAPQKGVATPGKAQSRKRRASWPAGNVAEPHRDPSGSDAVADPSPALGTICSTPPTELGARPRGWKPPVRVTPAQARFARSLLGRPLGTWRERRIAGRRVAARVEWHCSAERGWHEGVSVFVRGGRR